MTKWKNFSFRGTQGGNSTWSGGTITDPQDSTQETNVVLPTTSYPTIALDGSSYGRTGGSTPTGTNTTPTNSGNDPLLGGYHTLLASNNYQFDVAPGVYDVRMAFAQTTTRTVGFLFDGTTANVYATCGYPSSGFRFWVTGVTYSVGDYIVSKTDKGVWELIAVSGVTGSVEPNGAIGAADFVDGGHTWRRKNRDALAWIDGTPSGATRVVDQNSTMDLASSWQAKTPISVTVTGTYGNAMCLMRPQTTSYPRQFSYRVQPFDLVALTVTDEKGVNVSTTPTFFAQEPSGTIGLKLVTVTGANFAANFTLTGDLASYFTPTQDGNRVWLINTTPIPDNLAGSRSLIVRHTDAEANAPGYFDTTLTVTVVSSAARITSGRLGLMTTGTWMRRKTVKGVVDNRWAGYTNQSFVSDVTAAGDTALRDAYAAITPNGTGWYRIRVQDGGTWVSKVLSFAGDKDFGTGGLLIEPDTGHNPIIRSQLNEVHGRGVHFRNLTFAPQAGSYSIYCTLKTAAPYARLRFTGCNIGTLFADSSATWANWGDFSNIMFHEEFVVENNILNGLQNVAIVSGGRLFGILNNRYNNIAKDFHAFSPAYYNNTPRGVFADNHSYCEISGNKAWCNPDVYTGLTGAATPHGDWFQFRRFGEGAYGFSQYPNGNSSARWVVGNRVVNLTENRLYVVASTADNGSFTAGVVDTTAGVPTGTSAGQVRGGVTFDYDKAYIGGVNFYLWMENNAILQQGETINADGNATPNIQFVIDSNGAFGNNFYVGAFNNICGSGNTRGIGGGTHIDAEYNSFVGPATSALEPDIPGIAGTGGRIDGYIRARRNFLGLNNTSPYITAGAGQVVWSSDNIAINWKNAPVSPYKPSDHLVGPFVPRPTALREECAIGDTGSETITAFESQLSKTFHHKLGTHGAKLREEFTITISDSAGNSTTRTLVVSP